MLRATIPTMGPFAAKADPQQGFLGGMFIASI